MSNEEKQPGYCNASTRDGRYCGRKVSEDGDRCYMHGGSTPDKDENPDVGNGNQDGNGNAISHGVQASPFNLYDHLDDDAVSWIDELAKSYREVLKFSKDDPRNERILRACIHVYQTHSGENRIMEDGLSESQTIGISETGQPVVKDDGHHLHTVTLKRDKEARQILRTLGAFDDPESQKADAMEDMGEAFMKSLKASYE